MHGSSTLDTIILAAGTVTPGQIKPARTASAGLGVGSKQVLLASLCGQEVQLVTGSSHSLLLTLGMLANVSTIGTDLSGTEVGVLTVAPVLALVSPLATLHTGTLSGQSGALQQLTLLQDLLAAVGKVDSAHVGGGDVSVSPRTPWLPTNPLGLLTVALSLPIKCPLATSHTGTARGVSLSHGVIGSILSCLTALRDICGALDILPCHIVTIVICVGRTPGKV